MKIFNILDENLENADKKQEQAFNIQKEKKQRHNSKSFTKDAITDEAFDNYTEQKVEVDEADIDYAFSESEYATTGLSSIEAKRRLEKYGKNELSSNKKKSALKIFLFQYKDIMTMILLICTVISIIMGDIIEAITIAIIVLLNGILGFIQEYRAEKTLDALKSLASPVAKAIRDNKLTLIKADELVIGDVILLESGDKIPADCEILEAHNLQCDESMLTGESIAVKKSETNDSKKSNELFMGCIILKGHAKAIIKKIGMDTQMGKIAFMLSNIEEKETPLQKRLGVLSKYIAIGCLGICFIVSFIGILKGEKILDMLLTGVSLAVAAVPEGLSAIVTIALSLSISRMVKRNALVKRLHSAETLGCATVICTDKTGTLTQNKMGVTKIITSNGIFENDDFNTSNETNDLTIKCIGLCNNAKITKDNKFGDQTEISLLEFLAKHHISKAELDEKFKRLSENPFDSDRKIMSVVAQDNLNNKFLFIKGGYDIILDKCISIKTDNGIEILSASRRNEIEQYASELADNALRLIGIAYKPISPLMPSESEDNLIFLSILGMIDPPRKEVKDAVFRCKQAGIKPIMITGDHKKTAVAIAKDVGIYRNNSRVLTGKELDRMSETELAKIIDSVSVCSRVSPKNKLQIIKALRKNGHIIAMTGDGVNDAPAIKDADIGVSMGITGTDVSKEAADIILLDDNFSTLVDAIEEGRSIYANIRKFIRYLLACNIGEVLTMFLGILMGMPIILLPIQILLVNLVTDGLPAIALGLEPSEKSAMTSKPRSPDEHIFSNGLGFKIIIRGIFIGVTTLLSFVVLYKATGSLIHARSAALFSLIFSQLIHVFECKSENKSIIHINLLSNIKLVLSVLVSLTILFLVLYIPFFNVIFSTVPLTFKEALTCIGICFIAPILNVFFEKKS